MSGILQAWYRRRVTLIAVGIMLIVVIGVGLTSLSFGRLSGDRHYTVRIRHFGMDAEEMESSITIPLEDAIALIQGVQELRSISELNSSRINVTVGKRVNQKEVFFRLRDAVDGVYRTLPPTVQRPELFSSTGAERPVMIIAFPPEKRGLALLRGLVEREIKPRIEKIPGAGEVEIGGGDQTEIHIRGHSQKLHSYQITLADLAGQIRESYGNFTPAVIEGSRTDRAIVVRGRFDSLALLSRLPIQTLNGEAVPLSELARVSFAYKKRESVSRVNGKEHIVVYVKAAGTESPINLSRNIRTELEEATSLPYKIIYDYGEELWRAILDLLISVTLSISAVTLFLFLFLGNLRAIIALAVTLLVDVAGTVAALSFLKIPIDLGILAGFAVGIGLLADTGIIMASAIGEKNGVVNGLSGAIETLPAIFASTATTVIVLTPLFFLPDVEVAQMATAFLTLMLVSLGMSVFFVPPLIAANSPVFKPKVAGTRLLWKILLYHRRFPVGGLTAAAVLTLLVPFAFFHLPKGLSKGIEDPIIFAQVEFPSGTQAAIVDSRLSWLSGQIAAIKGVERVESMARRTKGTLSVRFNSKRISRVELEDLLDEYNDVLYQGFLFIDDRGSTAKEIVIDLIGPDDRYLRVAARTLAGQFSARSWVRQSVLHFKAGEPRLILDIDHSRAQAAGVDPAVAAASLRWGLFGPVIVKWIDDEGEMDVRVMGSEELFDDVSSIRKSGVINDRGEYVSLESIGNFETGTEPGRIYRLNRQRSVSMSIQTTLSSLDAIVQNVEAVLANFPLKTGHGFRIDPALERSTKQYRLLGFSLVIAAFLVFLVLAAQYESLTAPLIIILSIPVSLACPLFVLTITGSSLTFPSLVGMIVVTGLVVNNTILLVDDMLFRRKKYGGISTWQALRHALRKRFRPLVLTTGSTLLGLVPLLLSWGAASGMLYKLAFTVFWGILGSAFAALFILPGVFLLFPALTKRWPELSKS